MFRKKRKKRRLFRGIRFKTTMGLCVLFVISGFLLYGITIQQLNNNMENRILQDMLSLKANSEVYIRQLLVLREANNDAASFSGLREEIINELYTSSGYDVAAYNLEGDFLGATQEYAPSYKMTASELEKAKSGEGTIVLQYDEKDSCQVYFIMPLDIQNKIMGIVFYMIDYSEQQRESTALAVTVLQVAAGIFVFTFLVVLLLVSNLVRPIQKLTDLTGYVAHRIKSDPLKETTIHNIGLSKRKDEIGELFGNYQMMLEIIGAQFYKINDDKERILELLNSRQEFFNNVTHELKTPLTTINGYAQLIQEDDSQDHELLQTGIEHIRHESTRLHKMVVQLLEMSNREVHMDLEKVDIVKTAMGVAESMEMKANRYKNHIKVESPEDTIVNILGVESRIKQLLINLIDNAIKYGRKNEDIIIRISEDSEHVLLEVKNYGEGLTERELKSIFDPFYRADKEYSRELGSAGLGLAICKKIAEEHGGDISVQSRPDEFTIFTIFFPRIEKEGADNEKNI